MKKVSVILAIIVVLISSYNVCFARTLESYSGFSIGGKDIVEYRPDDLTESDYGSAFELGSVIVTALTTIGIVLSTIVMVILGIKYVMGSIEEKAEYKKTMLPMFLGCIFILVSASIVAIIYKLILEVG